MNKYCKKILAGILAALLMGELPVLTCEGLHHNPGTYASSACGYVAYAAETESGRSEEGSQTESSKAESSKAETSKAETSKAGTSKAETSKAETSLVKSSIDLPVKSQTEAPVSLAKVTLLEGYSQGYKIRLSWKRVKGADGYRIYKLGTDGRWKSWRILSGLKVKNGKVTYIGGNLAPGRHVFTVCAYVKKRGEYICGKYDTTGRSIRITGWDLQTNYPEIPYRNRYGYPRSATIASGGCGAVSVGNLLRNLMGFSWLTTREICSLATKSGARYNGGTDIETLLYAAQKKWGRFAYFYTEYDATMKQCLQSGGMVVAHTTGRYPLVSSSGHFVVLRSVSANRYTVFDSYYYEGKWQDYAIRRNYVHTSSEIGCIQVSPTQVHRAFDYYWLVKPATIQKATQTINRFFNGKKGITIYWNKKSNQATGYKIYRRSGKGSYTLIKRIKSGNILSYQDTNVKKGRRYTYKVVATNGCLRSKALEKSVTRRVPKSSKKS